MAGRVEEGVETLVSHVRGDRARYEAAVSGLASVRTLEVVGETADGFMTYLRAALRPADRALGAALDGDRVVLVYPLTFVADGTVECGLVGPAAALDDVLATLPGWLTVESVRVGPSADVGAGLPERRLTARQREALAAARAVGYYDVPRTGRLETVAEELDCARGTASELLRRAERRLVDAALEGP